MASTARRASGVFANRGARATACARRTGRPTSERLSVQERSLLTTIMEERALRNPAFAELLGVSNSQAYRVRRGEQGYRGGASALFAKLLVLPVIGQECPASSRFIDRYWWETSGFATCAGAPVSPRWHVGIDYLTRWGQTAFAVNSPEVDAFVDELRSRGYGVKDRRTLPRKKRSSRIWAISVNDPRGLFSFRAFRYTDSGGVEPSVKLELRAGACDPAWGGSLARTFVQPLCTDGTLTGLGHGAGKTRRGGTRSHPQDTCWH